MEIKTEMNFIIFLWRGHCAHTQCIVTLIEITEVVNIGPGVNLCNSDELKSFLRVQIKAVFELVCATAGIQCTDLRHKVIDLGCDF